jgi:hypothetical protein
VSCRVVSCLDLSCRVLSCLAQATSKRHHRLKTTGLFWPIFVEMVCPLTCPTVPTSSFSGSFTSPGQPTWSLRSPRTRTLALASPNSYPRPHPHISSPPSLPHPHPHPNSHSTLSPSPLFIVTLILTHPPPSALHPHLHSSPSPFTFHLPPSTFHPHPSPSPSTLHPPPSTLHPHRNPTPIKVSTCTVERCKLHAFGYIAFIFTALVYPLVAHWVWSPHAWLASGSVRNLRYYDFAGSGPVHVLGGYG